MGDVEKMNHIEVSVMFKFLVQGLLVIGLLSLMSCKDQQEADDLAKAQDCLDKISEAHYADAEACMDYIESYSSQRALILKCSILMTAGGLTETKIIKGYNVLKNDSLQNKEAAFMAVMSLENPQTTGYEKAVQANEYCQQTEIPGMQYVSTMILTGTAFQKTMADLAITFDPNNPQAGINSLMSTCGVNPVPAQCADNVDVIGASVVEIADVYCGTESADNEVCTQLHSAVSAAGGDTSKVGNALFCYMQTPVKSYNPATDGCI